MQAHQVIDGVVVNSIEVHDGTEVGPGGSLTWPTGTLPPPSIGLWVLGTAAIGWRDVAGILVPPAPMQVSPDALARRIGSEFVRRIERAVGGKAASIQRELTALQNIVLTGGTLTNEQRADVTIILAINGWETAMIGVREQLIAAADATYADDAHWPPPPEGLTAAWLQGY